MVTDDHGAIGTDEAVVTVRTPAEAVQDVICELETLNLEHGENGFISQLENAIYFLEKNQIINAEKKLGAFISQVDNQRGKKLRDAQADELMELAQRIMNNM